MNFDKDTSRISRATSSGSNEIMELPPPPILHELEPMKVMALEGKKVNEFSVFKGGTLAFVASACYTISPSMGPVSGGTNLTITGGGFWDSPDIVVRFSPAYRPKSPDGTITPAPLPRSAIGKYMGIDPETKQQVITCRAPKFASTGEVVVEVAVNGKDFTSSGRQYLYYATPELSGMEPTTADIREEIKVRIDGEEIFDTGLIKVKFKLKDGEDSEYMTDGHCITQSLGFEFNEETEEEEEVFEKFITATVPEIKATTPVEAKVSVALNGTSFVNVPNVDFIFHKATLQSIFPISAPIMSDARLEFHGIDFFDRGGGVMANFYLPGVGMSLDEEDNEPDTVQVTLEGHQMGWCSVPDIDLGISTCSKCTVDFSLDEFKTVLGSMPLTLYKNPKFRFFGTECGPVNTVTQIVLQPETKIFRTKDCKVRFFIPDHLDVIVMATCSDTRPISRQQEKPKTASALDIDSSHESILTEAKSSIGSQGRLNTASDINSVRSTAQSLFIEFNAPQFDWGEQEDEDDSQSRPGSKASRSVRSKSRRSSNKPAAPKVEEEKEEDENDSSIGPDVMNVIAEVSVALNGVNFSPHTLQYMYYKDPKITSIDPPQGSKDGGEIRLSGIGFFESSKIKVRCKSSPGKKGDCEGLLELDGTFDSTSQTIFCTLPALSKEEFASPLHIDLNMNGKIYTGRQFDYPYK